MTQSTRRTFLKQGSLGAAGAALALGGGSSRAYGANERIVFGLIGCGGRGCGVAGSMAGQKDAAPAYVCDPDETRRRQAQVDV